MNTPPPRGVMNNARRRRNAAFLAKPLAHPMKGKMSVKFIQRPNNMNRGRHWWPVKARRR